ncbi:MAG: DUF3685 domain-containing protein [Oscillatoriales cyanobacterium SM2_1_8]|nr:DUF3685 domain-containing protein [Oscillatoriales cyanobacterium SM2_1_8]
MPRPTVAGQYGGAPGQCRGVPLLNRCASRPAIRQVFLEPRRASRRQLERFRNNLSWHYRVEVNFGDPRAAFESRHRLLTFQDGIQFLDVRAPAIASCKP